MKSIKTLILAIVIFTCLFAVIAPVLAQSQDLAALPFSSGVKKLGSAVYGESKPGNLFVIIASLVNIVLTLLGLIFVGLMLFAGYSWMTSMGETEKIKKAKGTIINAAIGLVIIILSLSIWIFISNALINNGVFDGESDTQAQGEDRG